MRKLLLQLMRSRCQLVNEIGAKNCYLSMDHGLPDDFYPDNFTPKKPTPGSLKLLWVGRFMLRGRVCFLSTGRDDTAEKISQHYPHDRRRRGDER